MRPCTLTSPKAQAFTNVTPSPSLNPLEMQAQAPSSLGHTHAARMPACLGLFPPPPAVPLPVSLSPLVQSLPLESPCFVVDVKLWVAAPGGLVIDDDTVWRSFTLEGVGCFPRGLRRRVLSTETRNPP